MWLLSLFQRKHVPNCVVPHVWFVGEAVSPWAALGRALSAPSGLVCLTDRCQAHGCHLDTWSIWQMLKFFQSHAFICKSSHSYFQKEKKMSLFVYSKASVVHLWEMPSTAEVRELPTWEPFKEPQSIPEPPHTASCHHSRSFTCSICHFTSVFFSEYSLIQYSPCFRIFPLDQELAHYHLWAKSRPVACFSQQSFIGKQPHSFIHILSMTSLCVLQLSNCDREFVTYKA